MGNRGRKAALLSLAGMLALGLLALAWALGQGSSEAQEGAMHNCPEAGKWSIATWSGQDAMPISEALASCSQQVDVAYRINPHTQAWTRYFRGRPEISNLATLDNGQGVIALGSGVSAASIANDEPLRAAANGMLGCPLQGKWAIAVWAGDDGTDTEQAFATCGEEAVTVAYSIDPETQVWSRWFAGRPDISNLTTLNNMQGVMALGDTQAPAPTPAPTPTGTPPSGACVPQVPPEGQANLFHNPGFESGREPWCSLHPEEIPPFEVSQDFAHSGESSALLRMRVPAQEEGKAKVFYLVQEVMPEQFPELISGYYRVENWTKGTPKQYLQFVVIAFNVPNLPGGYPNHQMRYPLAGISEEPFAIANAFFVFIGKEEPRVGQWVYFERNIKEDFEEFWGAVPEGFDKIRVLFEVRYDDKEAGLTPANADVYYDDLYMGPASENPNRAAGFAFAS